MKDLIIEDNRIVLNYTKIRDLDTVMEIEKENSNFVYLWSKEKHIQTINDNNWLHAVIRCKQLDQIIGYVLLDGIGSEHETMELTRIALDKKDGGFGRKTIRLIKKLCFETYGCHRLWLDVFDHNERAIHLYKSEGFFEEGIMRECRKNNEKRCSMRIMSILKDEYFKLNK